VGDEEQKDGRTGYDRIGRVAVWLAVIVGGWFFDSEVVESPAEHHPARVAAGIVAAGFLAYGAYRWQEWRSQRRVREWNAARGAETKGWSDQDWHDRHQEVPTKPNFKPNRAWLPPLIVFGVIVVVGGWMSGNTARSHVIKWYCSYGAVSQAQLAECESKVSSKYIESLDTNAARFAEGRLETCLQDGGPYCESARSEIEAAEQAPRPGE
jgi:hypothetical protein